jgi:hypothetical protein
LALLTLPDPQQYWPGGRASRRLFAANGNSINAKSNKTMGEAVQILRGKF